MRRQDGVAKAGDDAFAADDKYSFVDEGDSDDDGEEFPSDAQLNLARRLHAHAHALALKRQTRSADLSTRSRTIGIDIVSHDDDDNRGFEKAIEGRNGRRCDYNVANVDDHHCGGLWDECDGELDDEEDEAMQQDSCVFMLLSQAESPWPPAPDDASATGYTYDDITKMPPPHLWCVVSPLSSLPPTHWCTFSSLPRLLSPRVEAGSDRALREAVTRLFGA
jgi:hypothetical protein